MNSYFFSPYSWLYSRYDSVYTVLRDDRQRGYLYSQENSFYHRLDTLDL